MLSPPEQGPRAGCGVTTSASALGRRWEWTNQTCCHQTPPASPLAPGGGGQEVPREEQQGKAMREVSCFSAGLVGERKSSRQRGERHTSTWGKVPAEGESFQPPSNRVQSRAPACSPALAWRRTRTPPPPTSVALQQSSPLPCSAARWLSSSGCCSSSPCWAGGGQRWGDVPRAAGSGEEHRTPHGMQLEKMLTPSTIPVLAGKVQVAG